MFIFKSSCHHTARASQACQLAIGAGMTLTDAPVAPEPASRPRRRGPLAPPTRAEGGGGLAGALLGLAVVPAREAEKYPEFRARTGGCANLI